MSRLGPRLARVAKRLTPRDLRLDFPFLRGGLNGHDATSVPPDPDPLAEQRLRRLDDLDRIAERL